MHVHVHVYTCPPLQLRPVHTTHLPVSKRTAISPVASLSEYRHVVRQDQFTEVALAAVGRGHSDGESGEEGGGVFG